MSPLTRRKLDWLVRARGTDLSAWPDRERLAALELLRRSPEAQLAFADALDAEDQAAPDVDRAVFERMQAALRRSLAPLSPLMHGLRAGALIACVAAGVYVAAIQSASPTTTDPDTQADPFTSAQTISLAALDQ